MQITPEELKKLREDIGNQKVRDAELIVAAREWLPRLLDEVEELQRQLLKFEARNDTI